jgi:hypothetical protein
MASCPFRRLKEKARDSTCRFYSGQSFAKNDHIREISKCDVNKTTRLDHRLAVAQNPFFCQIGFGAFYYQDVITFSLV